MKFLREVYDRLVKPQLTLPNLLNHPNNIIKKMESLNVYTGARPHGKEEEFLLYINKTTFVQFTDYREFFGKEYHHK